MLTEYTEIDDTTLVIYARFNPGFTIEATEAGLFIDSTATASNGSGSLLARTKFDTPITKDTDDAMTIEWTVNVINGVA